MALSFNSLHVNRQHDCMCSIFCGKSRVYRGFVGTSVSVGISLKELRGQMSKCLKFCTEIEI